MSASLLFNDDNIFTVATMKNSQNDRLYAHPSTKKKDVITKRLRTQINVQSLMASVSKSTSGWHYTSLIFVDHGVKVSKEFYIVTTVPACHMSDLKQVLHLSAGQCPGGQGTWGNQFSPITVPTTEWLWKLFLNSLSSKFEKSNGQKSHHI